MDSSVYSILILLCMVHGFSSQVTYPVTFNSDETEILIDLSSGLNFTKGVTVMVDGTNIPACVVPAGGAGSLCAYEGPLVPGQRYVVTIQDTAAVLQTNTLIKAPSPPTSVTINAQLTPKSSLTVSWTTDSTSRDGFLLHVDRTDGILTNISISDESKRKHTIASLLPGREYSIGVRSVSSGVLSDVTRADTTYTLPEAPDGIKLEALDTKTLSVKWTPKATSTQSSFETQCRFRPDGNSWMTVSCTGADNTCLIDVEQVFSGTSVKAGMPYYVRVCAVRPGVKLSCTQRMEANTKPNPPTDFSLKSRTTSSLTVQWSAAADTVMDGHDVTVNGVTGTWTANQVQNRYETNIGTLDSGKEYTIYVAATSGTEKSTATSVSYHTMPPKPPVPTRVEDESASKALTVTWDAPSQTSAEFGGYTITITKTGGSLNPLQQRVVQADQPRTATFPNLTPGAQYTVSLGTVVSDAHSEPTTANFYTKPLSPENLSQKPNSRSSSSLSVTWDPPKDGEFDEYKVKVLTKEETLAKWQTREALFNELQAGKIYDVILIALSGGQKSEETSILLYTNPNSPRNVALKDNSLSPDGATVTWDPPDGGGYDGFRLALINRTINQGLPLVRLEKTETEYSWSTLAASTLYSLKVEALVNASLFSIPTPFDFTTKPKPPRELKIATRGETHLEFTWINPDQLVGVDKYEYTVIKQGEATGLTSWTTSLTAKQDNLTPGTNYTIQILAVKSDIKSGETSIEESTVPADVGSISVDSKTSISITIMWPKPNSQYDDFEVAWLPLSSGDQPQKATVKDLLTYQIAGLTPGQTYTITVRTKSNGLQSGGMSVDATTYPSSVAGLVLGIITTQSIPTSWKKPTGVVSGYKLNINPKDGQIGTFPITINDPDQEEYTFLNLSSGKTYTLYIRVVTPYVDGDWVPKIVTTRPLKVEQLGADTLDSSHVTLKWGTSRSSLQNSFRIMYNGKEKKQSAYANQYEYSAVIDMLLPGSTTTFTVQPFAGAGANKIGGAKETVAKTTLPSAVSNLQVEIINASMARLTWEPEATSTQDKYQVRYFNTYTTNWASPRDVIAPELNVDFNDLFPGIRYKFEVVAQSNDQRSTATETFGITYPLPPHGVTVDRSRTTVDTVVVQWRYDPQVTLVTDWKIRYRVTGTASWTDHPYFPSEAIREASITGLVSGQNYTVCVYSRTVEQVSNQKCTSVDATVRPRQLQSLTEVVDQTTTTQVTLQFTPPWGTVFFDRYVFSINTTSGTSTKTRDPGDDAVISFSGLVPGTLYRTSAITVSGLEQSDVTTLDTVTVPQTPTLTCTTFTTSLVLHISKPVQGSVDKYNIHCAGTYWCGVDQEVNYVGDKMDHHVTGLRAHESFEFSVKSLLWDKYSEVVNRKCNTGEAPPDVVSDVKHDNLRPDSVTLRWGTPTETFGVIRNYYVQYEGQKEGKEDHVLSNPIIVPAEAGVDEYKETVRNLTAGFSYTFWVWAATVEEGTKVSYDIITPIEEPNIVDTTEPNPTQKVEWNQFIIDFANPFDNRNGDVVAISVIVTTGQDEASNHSDITASWNDVQNTKPSPPYAAIYRCPDLFTEGDECWNTAIRNQRRRKRAAPGDSAQITVGGDTDCSGSGRYCNGPLQPDTVYRVFIRGYTENGLFADGTTSEPIKTGPKPVQLAIIIAVVLVVVLLVVAAVVIFIILRRKGFICQCPNHSTRGGDPDKPHKPPPTKARCAILLNNFPQHVTDMTADNDFKFAAEYEEFKMVGTDQSCDAAEHQANRLKNRYINILSYDHSRVKLLPTDDEEGSDYINASWMPGYNSKREYIVSQGPLKTTVDEMWRMIWEYNCQAIVMLTKCVENGREKCAHYWPLDSEPVFHGDLQVAILNKKETRETCVSEIEVSQGELSRRLPHFYYQDWPDFGVPKRAQALLKFVRMVRGRLRSHAGPVVVHCSAGVGRSGTFIVVDRILQHMKENKSVDIFGIVHEMRMYRPLMVQTEAQYVYAHKCLNCVLEGKEHEEENEACDENSETDSGTSSD